MGQKLVNDRQLRVQLRLIFKLPCRVDEFGQIFHALLRLFPPLFPVMLKEA